MASAYEKRRDIVLATWEASGVQSLKPNFPHGAFYVWWDFSALKIPVQEISESLLEDVGVAVVPGSAYGTQGEGYVRMTLAASTKTIEEGVRRMLQWCQKNEG
jgi:aspartate/methionine/tyrosine aminotransferase